MTKLVHFGLQVIATVAQVAAVASEAVPPKYKALVVSLGSLAQALLALANHNGASMPNVRS